MSRNCKNGTFAKLSSFSSIARTSFDSEGKNVAELENWIDELDADLPKLTQFILPVSLIRGSFH